MSQDLSTSLAHLLSRLASAHREPVQPQQLSLFDKILAPGNGDHAPSPVLTNTFDAVNAASSGVNLQSALNAELERAAATALIAHELFQKEAAERARQESIQRTQLELAERCLKTLLAAAAEQQLQGQPLQARPSQHASSNAPPALNQDNFNTLATAASPTAAKPVLHIGQQPQQDMKPAPAPVTNTKKKPAKKQPAKQAKKKSAQKKTSSVKKQKKPQNEDPDSLSYPCRCRGLPENHNPRTAFISIPKGVVHGQALRCSHPICRSRGVRFRYCSACRRPVAKRNFSTRHNHTEAELKAGESMNANTTVQPTQDIDEGNKTSASSLSNNEAS